MAPSPRFDYYFIFIMTVCIYLLFISLNETPIVVPIFQKINIQHEIILKTKKILVPRENLAILYKFYCCLIMYSFQQEDKNI